jgi:DMSO/TMAO reductase YedYZ molybdopterin-dependent catalytic subunit
MQRAAKITLAVFLVLVAVAVPFYFCTRPASVQAGTLQIRGQVSNPLNITFNQLQTYPSLTLQVSLSSSSRPSDNGVFNYTGVTLKTLLEQAQVFTNASTVYIQASDGYGTTLPIQVALNQNTIIAYQKNGTSLTPLKDDGEGPLRLVIGSDQYAQRWVRGVAAIEVS